MGEIMNQIWPYLLTAMVTAVGTYVGAIHKLRIKVAVLENRLERVDGEVTRVDKRLDKKSEQFDRIQEDISDIREKLARIAVVLDMEKKGGVR